MGCYGLIFFSSYRLKTFSAVSFNILIEKWCIGHKEVYNLLGGIDLEGRGANTFDAQQYLDDYIEWITAGKRWDGNILPYYAWQSGNTASNTENVEKCPVFLIKSTDCACNGCAMCIQYIA